MAKIAVKLESSGTTCPPVSRPISSRDGWSMSHVVCTAGPTDRPFEEQHSLTSIAVVLHGTFQYRTPSGQQLMTPGSLLLGNAGDCFCCGHEHGTGDRCLSVSYEHEFFERIAADAGAKRRRFTVSRIPPLRTLAALAARASRLLDVETGLDESEEFAIALAAQAVQIAQCSSPIQAGAPPSALARVTRVVRMIEHEPGMPSDLKGLARMAGLSPFHFLRTFQELTGTTPHQYLLRMRLRCAAKRLQREPTTVLEIAFDCGFGDISNFNRTFRAEFGVSPTVYRRLGRS